MDARKRAELAAQAAADKKAAEVTILDLRGITLISDYFVLCHGANKFQVQAIADGVKESMREAGHRPLGEEGYADGRWVLLDYGDVIVHIFHEDERNYYALERLWGDAERIDVEAVVSSP